MKSVNINNTDLSLLIYIFAVTEFLQVFFNRNTSSRSLPFILILKKAKCKLVITKLSLTNLIRALVDRLRGNN